MKLKGHVKLTLHNCRTGKNEIVEGSNIVTLAVPTLLSKNLCGAVEADKIFGSALWRKWFGGVLLYEQAHPTIEHEGVQVLDPSDYYPRSDSLNHVFAHAGQNSIDPEHDDDLTRGNPVSAAFVVGADYVKQVFEWGSTRGNVPDGRYIRALSLTHSDVGDAGLGSNTYAFQNFIPFEKISAAAFTQVATPAKCLISSETIFGQYDDYHGFCFAIGEDGEYGPSSYFFQTNKVTIYKKLFPFLRAGLHAGWSVPADFTEKFTVTSSNITFYTNPCYYFDYENKRLWLFSNATRTSYDKSHISYIVIDCESKTEVDHGTITSDTEDLAYLGYVNGNAGYNWQVRALTMAIIKEGNYFYFPTASAAGLPVNGYKRININSQADQSAISFQAAQSWFTQSVYGGPGRLVSYGGALNEMGTNSGIVVNGGVGYPCKAEGLTGNSFNMAYSDPYSPLFFGMGVGGNSNLAYTERFILANKMLNTTLFNLPNPVQKTSSQSMTVEYTLQEVSGNE